jgi:hypothetical protein
MEKRRSGLAGEVFAFVLDFWPVVVGMGLMILLMLMAYSWGRNEPGPRVSWVITGAGGAVIHVSANDCRLVLTKGLAGPVRHAAICTSKEARSCRAGRPGPARRDEITATIEDAIDVERGE